MELYTTLLGTTSTTGRIGSPFKIKKLWKKYFYSKQSITPRWDIIHQGRLLIKPINTRMRFLNITYFEFLIITWKLMKTLVIKCDCSSHVQGRETDVIQPEEKNPIIETCFHSLKLLCKSISCLPPSHCCYISLSAKMPYVMSMSLPCSIWP